MLYFTADTHFDHDNIIKYCNRPFKTIEEMNNKIVENFNSVVKFGDVLYIVGDFAFRNVWEHFDKLNGYVKIIPGSHDKPITKDIRSGMSRKIVYERIVNIDVEIEGEKKTIVLCHYAMRSWSLSHYGSWHLYGHHHGKLEPYGLSFDIGVDTNNFFPYSLDDVEKKMKTLKPLVDYRNSK